MTVKNNIRGLALFVVVAAVYAAIVWLLPATRNDVYWIAFWFGVAAIAINCIVMFSSLARRGAMSKLYGLPVARVGAIYMVVQVVTSVILMALSAIVPFKACVIMCGAVLASGVLGLIAVGMVRDTAADMSSGKTPDTRAVKGLRAQAAGLAGRCSDAEAKRVLEKLSEDLRCADPVTRPSTSAAEADLSLLLDRVGAALDAKDYDAARQLAADASGKLAERNALAKIEG